MLRGRCGWPGLRRAAGARSASRSAAAFSGLVGGPTGRDYTVIGDPVNVAARLAASARAGDACWPGRGSTPARHATSPGRGHRRSRVKGRSLHVAVAGRPLPGTPVAGAHAATAGRWSAAGRASAAARAIADATAAAADLVTGPAGIGKSRLVGDLHDGDGDAGCGRRPALRPPARPTGRRSSAGWPEPAPTASRTSDAVRRALAEVDPELAGLAPLVAELAGNAVPETAASRALDGERRARTARELLGALLRVPPDAGGHVMVLEDLHHAHGRRSPHDRGDARRRGARLAAARRGAPPGEAPRRLDGRGRTTARRSGATMPSRSPRSTRAGGARGAGPGRRPCASGCAGARPAIRSSRSSWPACCATRGRPAAGRPPAGLPDRGSSGWCWPASTGLPPDVQNGCGSPAIAAPPFDAPTAAGARPALGRRGPCRTLDARRRPGILEHRGTAFGVPPAAGRGRRLASWRAASRSSARRTPRSPGRRAPERDRRCDRRALRARPIVGAAQRRWFGRAADLAAARHDHERARHLAALVPLLRGAAPPRRPARPGGTAARGRASGTGGDCAFARRSPAPPATERLRRWPASWATCSRYGGDWDEGLELLDRSVAELGGAGTRTGRRGRSGCSPTPRSAAASSGGPGSGRTRTGAGPARLGDRRSQADALHKLAQAAWHLDGAAAAAPPAGR